MTELLFKGEFGITSVESDDQHVHVLTKPLDYTRRFAITGIFSGTFDAFFGLRVVIS